MNPFPAGITHGCLSQTLDQAGHKAVVNTFRHNQTRGRCATLACGIESAIQRAFDRVFQIRIVQNDQRVLTTHF